MAVHLPLSLEAQVEAAMLMISTNNIFSPAHGNPVIRPDLDIVMGTYFLTSEGKHIKGEGMAFGSKEEVFLALDEGRVGKRAKIKVRIKGRKVIGAEGVQASKNGLYETTVGRMIFNDILPEGMPYYNITLDKGKLAKVVSDCYQILSRSQTVA